MNIIKSFSIRKIIGIVMFIFCIILATAFIAAMISGYQLVNHFPRDVTEINLLLFAGMSWGLALLSSIMLFYEKRFAITVLIIATLACLMFLLGPGFIPIVKFFYSC